MTKLTECFGDPLPVVLVTGSGAPRVGREIGLHLLDCGYRVIFHAHRSLSEVQDLVAKLKSHGKPCDFVSGPVEDASVIEGWIECLTQRYGRIHALVHSAAIWNRTPLESATLEDLESHWRINALSPFLLTQKFGLAMVPHESGGSMVLIGDWAIERPYVDYGPYFLSKSTIPTVTRTMAVELAQRNPRVRVNAVLSGPVLLPPDTNPEVAEAVISESLLKRQGTPTDIAEACRYLLEAPFVTGACLPVDGGRSIYGGPVSDSLALRNRSGH